jgi:hypothetical protein
MAKQVLVIHYSQTGQLRQIVENFCQPFVKAGKDEFNLEHLVYSPKSAYPFPWSKQVFYDAMPETVLEVPMELNPLSFNREQYDLIILAYQPWFLSPSRPFSSLLQHPELIKRMAGTDIITLIGGRNMWLNAQESVKKHIQDAGGKLIGNVPFIDKNSNLLSAVTILHWLLTGKKTKKWGIFPLPGVSDEDIQGAEKFGNLAVSLLNAQNMDQFQEQVIHKNGVNISTAILFIEGRAKKLFRIWAHLITNKVQKGGNRKLWVNFFRFYLVFALFIVSPVVLTIYFIFVRPFTGKQVNKQRAYFSSTDLSKK